MRILYAIQGTGNGHITRSVSIINELKKRAEVDVLVSGIHNEVKLPINVNYNFRGLGFVFGQNGGINYRQTFKQNKLKTLFSEIKQLPVENYNFVVSDFEPVSVWAASRATVPTIGISNQVSVLHPKIKKPWPPVSMSRIFLENYAQCDYNIGLHFEPIDNAIVTPVIRDEIRKGRNTDGGYGLVYLPFYSDKIIYNALQKVSSMPWVVFSKHSKKAYQKGTIRFEPINGNLFNEKLLGCHIVLTAAGFGTTSEALHLGKKMIVVPMKGQYEQKFNAYTLQKFGVKILKTLESVEAPLLIKQVLDSKAGFKMNYPDNVRMISDKVMDLYNGPIMEAMYANTDPKNQPLDYYFNPTNVKRDPSGTLSY
ncbi:MAG: glycosyltransferase family protein [Bacteroidia bacterium]